MIVAGGKVKGGQVLGSYPRDLTAQGPYMAGNRGRVIPELGWEALWHGLADWLGVEAADMDTVIPNKPNFQGNPKRTGNYNPSDFSKLLRGADLFKN